VRCLHERKHRPERRFFGRHFDERDACPRPSVGIALVVAHELLRQERNIVDRAREHTDMIEGAREREHSVP
jgi:hypothetical protein